MSRAVDEDPGERFRRTVRFADLARELGVDLPPFRGPLVAFDPAPVRSPGDPVYLGGDLHAVHPDVAAPGTAAQLDESLDRAAISFIDGEGRTLETHAVEGVWCARLDGAALDCAPYLALRDTLGRMRTWILLARPEAMIDIAHLWLPRVPAATRPGR
jgi:hypothetical protein